MALTSENRNDPPGQSPEQTPRAGADNALLQLVKRNFRFIIIVAAFIIFIIIVYALIRFFEQRSLETDQAHLAALITDENVTAEERIKVLEGMLKAVSSDMRPAVAFELVRAGIDANDNAVVTQGWEALASSVSDLKIAPEMDVVAAIGRAGVLEKENDTAGAILILKELRVKAPPSFKPFILGRLAALSALAGENATAIDAYTELKIFDSVNAEEYDRRISALTVKEHEPKGPTAP